MVNWHYKMTGMNIAVLEDENSLRNDLIEYLQMHSFTVEGFSSAEALMAATLNSPQPKVFDLAIIDIGLTGISGLHAAQWLRSRSNIGIVILTALGSPSDQVIGLESGADAYLVKNTSLEVIEATCRSVLRRIGVQQFGEQNKQAEILPVNNLWRLSTREWALTLPTGKKILLTHTETLFLQCLLRQPGTPISRTGLLTAINKADTLANQRNLDNCASRLRRKILKQCGLEIPIRPSYGSGYTFTGEGVINGK
jgi:DNA-binding response OmpR family regulator